MELWTVGNKTIVLFFAIIASYFSVTEPDLWLVLFFLIYLALNLVLHIVKPSMIKQGMILLIIIYLISCSIYGHPYFALLLPLSFYELASFYARSNGYLFCAMLIPALFMRNTMLILYSFVTLLSFFNYIMVRKYMARVSKQDDEMERMRKDGQRLVKRLNENQEFLKVSEYMVKLEERNRLAQELHDGIGHSMTGSLIQMEAAKRLMHNDPQTAEMLLQNAIGISKEGIEEIRLTLKNNKPPMEQLGLSRLKTAVEAFGGKTGLMTTVVHEGDIEVITPLQWRIIYENVNESLTNAAKYAKASAVHIEIKVLNHFIKAVVSDNGQGTPKIVKGLGLVGMEERAAAVNGTIIADGSNGFSVTTLIPYGT
ncbi:sensor histidine kinase [Paenibacillus segetis]|uniref:histidine kinase n=1 Tax=Paenibacillus segetis TaxID=1325360 RepID=A0ABQ1YPG6_9BACL|nr:sensor histidine kinase [Paenibacillus segetis]GGH32063.1 two-component sensor histidine kinase [Paenibacillus segetis]